VLEAFSARFPTDPVGAARQLVDGLFSESARKAGKPNWVEMTPANVAAAPHLVALFPSARIVHMVRDGRDVACSRMLKRGDPQRDIARWVEHWERALLAADRAERQVPANVLRIRLEDLVRDAREESYRRLLGFLELSDEPGMRGAFERDIVAGRAHLGRWRHDLTEDERRVAERAYAAAVERLLENDVMAANEMAPTP
jgi:sulfotransferase family protein